MSAGRAQRGLDAPVGVFFAPPLAASDDALQRRGCAHAMASSHLEGTLPINRLQAEIDALL